MSNFFNPKEWQYKLALAGLKIGAIKINAETPFVWASGYQMPIYNDNRRFLDFPEHKKMIIQYFNAITTAYGIRVNNLAGTSTAGIPWAAMLSYFLELPMSYIRDKPKDHGLRNQIEGLDAESDYEGIDVIVIEDLISTGGSSAKAVEAARKANGNVDHILSIFNYGFPEAKKLFDDMQPKCEVISLLTYPQLLGVAIKENYLKPEQLQILEEWNSDPFGWGTKHGFPPIPKEQK
ncbi:MAG: orotate phosphoribosyltransferase [Candidatus Absconditicoccaceae bacterium]